METMELGHANVQCDFTKYAGASREETMNRIATDLTSGQSAIPRKACQTVAVRSSEEVTRAISEKSLLPWQ
jgi:uncharacterized hydantoinase/oxoprolinase family protein